MWVSPAAGYNSLVGTGWIVGEHISARQDLGGASLSIAGITIVSTAGALNGFQLSVTGFTAGPVISNNGTWQGQPIPVPANLSVTTLSTTSTISAGGAISAGSSAISGGSLLVSGSVSAGSVTSTGEITGTLGAGYGQFRAVYGNYGFMIRNDGATTYFLLTSSGTPYGTWNGLRPFYIDNYSGNVYVSTTLVTTTFNPASISSGGVIQTGVTGSGAAFQTTNFNFIADGNGNVSGQGVANFKGSGGASVNGYPTCYQANAINVINSNGEWVGKGVYMTPTSGYVAPSLTNQAAAHMMCTIPGGTELAINCAGTNYGYGYTFQVRNAGSAGYPYTIVLNPLGGNVGIGNINPGSKLTLVSNDNSDQSNALLIYANNVTQYCWYSFGGLSTSYWYRMQSGSGYVISMQAGGGNVCIGTNSDDGSGYRMQVSGGVSCTGFKISGTNTSIASDGTIWGGVGLLLQYGNMWVSSATGYSSLVGTGWIVGEHISARQEMGAASLKIGGNQVISTTGWYNGPGVMNASGNTMVNTASLWMGTNTLSVPAVGGYNMIDSGRNLSYVGQLGMTTSNYIVIDSSRNIVATSLNIYNQGGSGQITCGSLTCYGNIQAGGYNVQCYSITCNGSLALPNGSTIANSGNIQCGYGANFGVAGGYYGQDATFDVALAGGGSVTMYFKGGVLYSPSGAH
jgi:hypothetical protein